MGEAVSSLFDPGFRGAGREMVLNKDLIDGEKEKGKKTVPLKAQAGTPSVSRCSWSGPLVLPLLRRVPLQTALMTPFAPGFPGLTQGLSSAGASIDFSHSSGTQTMSDSSLFPSKDLAHSRCG